MILRPKQQYVIIYSASDLEPAGDLPLPELT